MKRAGSPRSASRFVVPYYFGRHTTRKTSSFTRAALDDLEKDAASKAGSKIYMRQDDNACGPRRAASVERSNKSVDFLRIMRQHEKRLFHYFWKLSRLLSRNGKK